MEQEQVNELLQQERTKWEMEILKPLQEELTKYKPPVKTEAEREVERLKAELLQQKVMSTLQQIGAEEFAEFIFVSSESEIQDKVSRLQEILKKRTVDLSFQPDNHRHLDPYSAAKKNGDNVGMLKSIFGIKN